MEPPDKPRGQDTDESPDAADEPAQARRVDAVDPSEAELFRREIESLREVPDKDARDPGSTGRPRRRGPKISRRLRRRQTAPPRIDETIDLHGMGREQAMDRLDRELPAALARGARRVLVITGRGRGSAGGVPILRGAVVTWMRREGSRWVDRWQPAERGGDGALIVWLRKQR